MALLHVEYRQQQQQTTTTTPVKHDINDHIKDYIIKIILYIYIYMYICIHGSQHIVFVHIYYTLMSSIERKQFPSIDMVDICIL